MNLQLDSGSASAVIAGLAFAYGILHKLWPVKTEDMNPLKEVLISQHDLMAKQTDTLTFMKTEMSEMKGQGFRTHEKVNDTQLLARETRSDVIDIKKKVEVVWKELG